MAINCVVLLPAMLGLVSLLLSLVSGLWCRFAYLPHNRFSSTGSGMNNSGNSNMSSNQRFLQQQPQQLADSYQVGVYFRRDQGSSYTFDSCVPYSFSVWDTANNYWRTAMVTFPLGWAIALLLLLCLFVSLRCTLSRTAYRVIGYIFVLVCVPCQALTYLVMASNLCRNNPQLAHQSLQSSYQDYCRLGTGGFLGIGALVGYVVTGTLCCCLSPKCMRSAAGTTKPTETAGPLPPSPPRPTAQPPPVGRQSGRPVSQSVLSQPTSYDEEFGGPASFVAAGAMGGAAAYGGGSASYNSLASRNQRNPNGRSQQPHPYAASAPVALATLTAAQKKKTIIPPHRMSYQEQRDLYSAAGHGAAFGAGAGPDTVYDIPSVVERPPAPSRARPGQLPPSQTTPSQKALMVAVATGAAVGARARADTVPEEAMDVPRVVAVETCDEDDVYISTVDDSETLHSVPVDLDEQNDLFVAVATGSEEGARARTDTLPAVVDDEPIDVASGDDDHEDENDRIDDVYYPVLASTRSHETRSVESFKPDPPTSWEDDDAAGDHIELEDESNYEHDHIGATVEDDSDSAAAAEDLRIAAETMMMGDFDRSAAEVGALLSDREDSSLGHEEEEGIEVKAEAADTGDSDPSDERPMDEIEPEESFEVEEHDYEFNSQVASALNDRVSAPSPTDTASDSGVEQLPDGVEVPPQPASERDVGTGSSASARWRAFLSRRQDGRFGSSSSLHSRHKSTSREDNGGPHDDTVLM